jgi:hypothetical protein
MSTDNITFNLSRDFLDGVTLVQPPPVQSNQEIKLSGGVHFLPSSPDKKLHTVVVSVGIGTNEKDPPFIRGGWRFLFSTSQAFEPEKNPNNDFLRQLLMIGTSKLMVVVNGLLMHANLPILPIDGRSLANANIVQGEQQPPVA